MTMLKRIQFVVFGILLALAGASAQDTSRAVTSEEYEEAETSIDGINETLAGIQSTLDALKKIKISGYVQSQFQSTQVKGTSTFAGGDFPANVNTRFSVRRGRFKLVYETELSKYALQIDVTQNGVGIKEANITVLDPWVKTYGLTAGIFDRPYGFEVSYSSGLWEAPERTRLNQTLFPSEQELGAKLEINPQEGPFSLFNLKAGVFNGVLNTANENNGVKDFVGRMGVQLPFTEENMEVDGGLSLYSGKVTNTSRYVYSIDQSASPIGYAVDSSASNLGGNISRVYLGGDLQFYYDIPGFGGLNLRGEYTAGDQPGTITGSTFYNPYTPAGRPDATAASALYKRKFSGWYLTYIQNIGNSHQFVARYDEYDPNTDVKGSDIGVAGSNLGQADVKYSTLGLGWIYHFDSSLKFTLYYDLVRNETVSPSATGALAAFTEDLKDDVFTFRAQFRF
jgi:hypothetical protein